MNVCIYLYMYICIYMYVNIYQHTYVNIYEYKCSTLLPCLLISLYINKHTSGTYTYIHTYIYSLCFPLY